MVERQQVGEEEVECEATMVALHKLASSIKVKRQNIIYRHHPHHGLLHKEGADKESREAFKILIQEYRPKGCQN